MNPRQGAASSALRMAFRFIFPTCPSPLQPPMFQPHSWPFPLTPSTFRRLLSPTLILPGSMWPQTPPLFFDDEEVLAWSQEQQHLQKATSKITTIFFLGIPNRRTMHSRAEHGTLKQEPGTWAGTGRKAITITTTCTQTPPQFPFPPTTAPRLALFSIFLLGLMNFPSRVCRGKWSCLRFGNWRCLVLIVFLDDALLVDLDDDEGDDDVVDIDDVACSAALGL